MAFLDFLFGKKEKTQQFQQYTPQQQQVLNQLLSQASQSIPQQTQFLQSLLSPGSEVEQTFAAPALRQFDEEIIPSIAERFTSGFGPGSYKSSAFGQQLGKAGAGLSEALAALRSQLGFQGISGLQGLLGTGLTPQYETAFRPRTQGLLGQGLGAFSQGLGLGLPSLLLGGR